MTGTLAERLREQLGVFDRSRQQKQPRRGALTIKLRQESAEHFARRQAAIGAREIGAVAPVLIRAEEKNLDTELARIFGDRENVGFLN